MRHIFLYGLLVLLVVQMTLRPAPSTTETIIVRKRYDYEWLKEGKRINEIWDDSGCEDFRKKEQLIPPLEMWITLRRIYEDVVGIENSRISPISKKSGFQVPFVVKQAAEKGRGVFATGNVRKGKVVWSATTNTAVFKDGDSYRLFVRSLPYFYACQAMGFVYATKTKSEGQKPWIAMDLDEGALINSGTNSYGKKNHAETDSSNIKCVAEMDGHPRGACYAIRDIVAGEEFLCDYDDFSDSSWFRAFGL